MCLQSPTPSITNCNRKIFCTDFIFLTLCTRNKYIEKRLKGFNPSNILISNFVVAPEKRERRKECFGVMRREKVVRLQTLHSIFGGDGCLIFIMIRSHSLSTLVSPSMCIPSLSLSLLAPALVPFFQLLLFWYLKVEVAFEL